MTTTENILAENKKRRGAWLITSPRADDLFVDGKLLANWLRAFRPREREEVDYLWILEGLVCSYQGSRSRLYLTGVLGPTPRKKKTDAGKAKAFQRKKTWEGNLRSLRAQAIPWAELSSHG